MRRSSSQYLGRRGREREADAEKEADMDQEGRGGGRGQIEKAQRQYVRNLTWVFK